MIAWAVVAPTVAATWWNGRKMARVQQVAESARNKALAAGKLLGQTSHLEAPVDLRQTAQAEERRQHD